jgi:hypothetical protein
MKTALCDYDMWVAGHGMCHEVISANIRNKISVRLSMVKMKNNVCKPRWQIFFKFLFLQYFWNLKFIIGVIV